jgi:glycerol-3-phosphate cytidylyltransferase-like family protein
MVDLTEEERMAILATVKPVAEIMEEIGWETRLSDLSEQQVLTLIEVAVGGFQEAMREIAASAPEAPL